MESLRERKLVVLGIPFDVETEELKYHMRKYGELDDCIVMKDRITGKSRGFGYVTFTSVEDARKVLSSQHVLNGRTLDIKVATPKDEMVPSAAKRVSRIFVARIPAHVTEVAFRSYFQRYGSIVDAYMPKDVSSRSHRGIGFVTFESPESVDKIMNETHELGGSFVAVDRATPKEETLKSWAAKPQVDDAGKYFSEDWTKALPEQWTKALPEQWAKMLPEQIGFYMAAAAAAAAQMGALGGVGNSMEGFDFSSLGFPGFPGTGEKMENLWNASDGEKVKAAGSVQIDDSAGAPKAPSPNTGYSTQAHASQSNVAAGPGYASDSATQNQYYSNMFSASNPDGGYGSNGPTVNMPSGVYSYPLNTNEQGGSNVALGYGQNAMYNTSSAPVYDAASYYNSATSVTTAPTAQTYGAEPSSSVQPPAVNYAAPGHSSDSFAYGGGVAVPSVTNAYESGVSYPTAVSNSAYTGSAYTGITSAANVDYGPSATHGEASATYKAYSPSVPGTGTKVFVGKLPHEATSEHLRTYFSSFGRVADVYVPKDPKKIGHRGFGFVTFFDEAVADQVSREAHEILGHSIAVDRPTPLDNSGNFSQSSNTAQVLAGGGSWIGSTAGMPQVDAGRIPSNFDNWAGVQGHYAGGQANPYYGAGASRVPRPDFRYRPY
ncbi:hypothetical protein KP509_01G051600 [Ceratopteris richardii]|uniref:RRM domain-containing protein n=1 Tax=Ceratopteris richardii TaxID=49495 RepID=A0A8T2VKL3_CERRI|nr:hypothetical protein KP509_01G051600 [Ceratopteris richardii]